MSWRLHDTIFGQVVRLLTSNKYYRYPDEIDATLWEMAVQKDPPAANSSTASGEESKDKEAQDGAAETQTHKVESMKTEKDDILLVGWYGPDDPEVVVPNPCTSFILLTV
jgi:DHA1 family multidrug resistance protein-like MFS transporter